MMVEMMSEDLGIMLGAAGAPDWSAQTEELYCPMCMYNLRGLTEPRCPECGYRFAWAELTDPTRKDHPYLFEHHARRWVWSFWKTAVGGLPPVRFWKALSPQQRSRPGLLLVYWLIATGLAVVGLGAAISIAYWIISPMWFSHGYGRMPSLLELFTWRHQDELWVAAGAIIYWPIATFLTLLIFSPSMRRAKVHFSHVLRTVVYGTDGLVWLLPAAATFFAFSNVGGPMEFMGSIGTALRRAVQIFLIWMSVRIYLGYRIYLRFDRPFLTVLASQVVVALLACAIVFWIATTNGWSLDWLRPILSRRWPW